MDNEQRTAPTASPPALGDAIEKLMANPELISMVASALGGAKRSPSSVEEKAETSTITEATTEPTSPAPITVGTDTGPAPTAPSPELGKLVATLAPLLSGADGGPGQDDSRACLLRALKPYVNPTRREAIDTMIRLSRISDVLRQLH